MTPRPRGSRASRTVVAPAPAAAGTTRAERWAVRIAAAGIVASQVLVDTGAESAFDAPKRLVALLAAAAAWLLLWPAAARLSGPPGRWLAPGLFAAALCWATLSAAISPHGAIAHSALRALLLTAVLVPVGAALPGDPGTQRALLGAFLAGCGVNAALALAQAAGLLRLFDDASIAGRTHAYGLVGNEGVLALALALGAVAASWAAALPRSPAVRAAAFGTAALLVAGVLATRNLTGIAAIAVGWTVLALLSRSRRAPAAFAAVLALLVATAFALPGPRGRLTEVAGNVRTGDWNAVLSFRGGPWAVARSMARDRPFAGSGPGTFAAEYVPRRLAAELLDRRRFPPPPPATGFSEAHADLLDAIAAIGWPGALAAGAAVALLLAQLARAARDPANPGRKEATLLLAALAAGAVAAATWFPFQRAATAVPLLLAAGRGWRVAAGPETVPGGSRSGGSRARRAVALALGVVLLAAFAPEVRRYAAERRLRATVAALRVATTGAPGDARAIDAARASAREIEAALPGDPRPIRLAGAALLLGRRPEEALAEYRRTNAIEERAENDLNMGRAWALLDRRPEAFAAFVRAAWIAPALLSEMPTAAQPLVAAEIARLERELRAGQLAAPPPAP